MIIVRFYVGTSTDQAVARIHAKLAAFQNKLQNVGTAPIVNRARLTTSPLSLTHFETQLHRQLI